MRLTTPSTMGGTRSLAEAIVWPASAMPDDLRSDIWDLTASSRSTGSSSCTGRSYRRADTRLSGTPLPASDRVDTGTRERTTAASTSSPRSMRRARYPPATAARTTSLTVPPKAVRMVLTVVERRRGVGPDPVWTDRTLDGERAGGRQALGEPDGAGGGGDDRPEGPHRVGDRARARTGSASTRSAARPPQASRTLTAPGGSVSGVPRLGLGHVGIGHEVEQHGEQAHPGDPVHHAVVDLEDHGPLPSGQALHQPDLPRAGGPGPGPGTSAGPSAGRRPRRPRGRAGRCGGRGSRGRSPGRRPRPGGPARRARCGPAGGTGG